MRPISKITNKWKLLLFAVCASLVLTIILFRSASNGISRPKAFLIYNNENLCSSKTPSANNQHHGSTPLAASETAQISIIIVIPSSRNNFVQRSLIRQTYGSTRNVNNIKILGVVFMLGDDPNTEKSDMDKLDAEWVRYGDIIVGDFLDTYRNLSRKSIMAYDWLTSFCQNADLVLKTDDDVVVDIFKLTAELNRLTPILLNSFSFWCALHGPETIDRDEKSRYYVSYDEYAKEKTPQHCAGVGYVTQMGVVHRIAKEISKSFLGPVCGHEDVFMTGIVPEKINAAGINPITYANKMADWVFYIDERNPNKDGQYIWKVITETANKTDDLDEFRKRSGTRIFYLLQHNAEFERKFMKLWNLVKNSFQNEEIVNKSQIN